MNFFLSWLGSRVYPKLAPIGIQAETRAKTRLVDRWRQGPPLLALAQTVAAIFLLIGPILFFYRPRPFHLLAEEERQEFFRRLSQSRIYYLRLMAQGLKTDALLASFSDEEGS